MSWELGFYAFWSPVVRGRITQFVHFVAKSRDKSFEEKKVGEINTYIQSLTQFIMVKVLTCMLASFRLHVCLCEFRWGLRSMSCNDSLTCLPPSAPITPSISWNINCNHCRLMGGMEGTNFYLIPLFTNATFCSFVYKLFQSIHHTPQWVFVTF